YRAIVTITHYTYRGFTIVENTFFGLVLFLIVYGFLIWLTDGGNIGFDGAKASSEDSPATTEVSSGEIKKINEVVDSSERNKPIEQQLKDILWDDEVEQTIPNDDRATPVITEEAVTKLNYRQARKVTRKLGIRSVTFRIKWRKIFRIIWRNTF
ncbi:MAG: hypothetical protein WBM86_24405, partial [Waterburya sp.]